MKLEEKASVLIVDDSPTNINVLFDTLERHGYKILVASDGETAIDRAKYAKPDLILLDIMMPKISGFEACSILKADDDTKDIPIIFITALSDTENKIRGFEAGAVDYITKPFQAQEVLARVSTHLKIRNLERKLQNDKEIIAEEKAKSDFLLHNILPDNIVRNLKIHGASEPESYDNVTVYFSDIIGFTKMSSRLEPKVLIDILNDLFTSFDSIMKRHDSERIKTIGDGYLAVCGMPVSNEKHAENIVDASLEIMEYMRDRNENLTAEDPEGELQIRIGIHTGNVVGGIVGIKKYIYDVFGDTINTAARMEKNSEPMSINVSEATYNLVKEKYIFKERELIDVKGKGPMKMFYVLGRR